MKYVGNKISYVRHPFAKNGFFSFGLGLLSLGLAAAPIVLSVRGGGQGGMVIGALGFSSIAFGIMGLWYSFLAFREQEKNYIFARIGLGLLGVVMICWVMVLIVGIRG